MGKPEQQEQFVTDANGKIAAPIIRRKNGTLEKWMRQPDWPAEATLGIERIERLWAAQPTFGKLTASYGEHRPGGATSHEERLAGTAADELARIRGRFSPAYWRCFEAVVRDGEGTTAAARFLKVKSGQASASVKVVCGLIASSIALG